MSRTVFVLGAGASREAGAPLMNDFLDAAEDLERSATERSLVFRAISELGRAHSKATLDVNNLESVYAAFEMANLAGRLGNLGNEEITHLVPELQALIARTLEARIRFPIREIKPGRTPQICPPPPYEQFAELLKDLFFRAGSTSVAVLTFNYDISIDYALTFAGVPVDYCLTDNETEGLQLLKLHGSLNWVRCPECRRIFPWEPRDFTQQQPWSSSGEGTTSLRPGSPVRVQVAERLQGFLAGHRHGCSLVDDCAPVIVPPTWNKLHHHQGIPSVWRRAYEHFADAENVFIIGYSLPETDEFFKYLWALGSVGPARLRRFTVVNPDSSVSSRFQTLLGQAAERSFSPYQFGFREAIDQIRDDLGGRRP